MTQIYIPTNQEIRVITSLPESNKQNFAVNMQLKNMDFCNASINLHELTQHKLNLQKDY